MTNFFSISRFFLLFVLSCTLNSQTERDLEHNRSNPGLSQIKVGGIKKMEIGLALTLHEDYDANGIYLFEPFSGGRPSSMAENILSHASKVIPRDLRSKIEGRTCRQGIIRPRPNKPPPDGIPEALHLYHANKCSSFTFETPSEFDLQRRIKAHRVMIDKAISSYLDTR